MAVIYVITQKSTGRKYVGATKKTMMVRWRSHTSPKGRDGSPLRRAIRRSGVEDFELEELEKCDDSARLERETYWIDTLGTLIPDGFNVIRSMSPRRRVQYKDVSYDKPLILEGRVFSNLNDPELGLLLRSLGNDWWSCLTSEEKVRYKSNLLSWLRYEPDNEENQDAVRPA